MPSRTTQIFNVLEIGIEIVIHYGDNVDDNDGYWWHLKVILGIFSLKTEHRLNISKITLVIYCNIFLYIFYSFYIESNIKSKLRFPWF